ncbi:MAG TPA: isoleucine--tRNA ligase [Candidatus Binatia bacterium]|nr:isoleucine--tRNA ligase [Candidatus Binatia bacterium]
MSVKSDLFLPVSTKLDLPETEARVLAFWRETKAFEESLRRREGSPPFVFYEGPPTANGLPGVHHVLSRMLKDIVCRYKAMCGFYVPRKGGWDTHGLPVEIAVERELGISGKDQIEKFGIAEFNRRCRESVLRYEADWRRMTERIGYWLDMDHPYFTFDNSYIESVWWLLRQYWDQGYLYQGHKIVPYCPRCGTPLSSHEVSLGYEEVTEPSVTVKFALEDEKDAYVLAWTTTPWTLPGNVALAVGPEIPYVRVRQTREGKAEHYYLAKARLTQLTGEYEIEKELKGRELQGRAYRRLFDFVDLAKLTEKKAYYVCEADFVTTEDGTGVVHTAVMYGADDYQLGRKLDLPQRHTVDSQGRFTAEVAPWAGRNVKESERDIIDWLKGHGLLYREEMTTHSYPFCWRCDTPLLYYAWKTWYISTTRYRDRMLEANRTVAWHPKEIGAHRFENWLENNVDWALSRNRYWGTPLPIWRCDTCGKDRCVGSIEELSQGHGMPQPLDLHRPHVDQVTFPCDCGGTARRVPEVIDVWFDSGSMPFAQWHYPFENKELFQARYPADYVSEGMDQTRGWFYTLMAIGVFAMGKAPYKHVLVNELILDKEGKKMSKSRNNAVDPEAVLNTRGADALRFYLISTSPPWTATRFDPEGVTEVTKKLLGTLKNTAQFFALYANIDGYEPAAKEKAKTTLLDRWALSRLHSLVAGCRDSFDAYDLTRGARAIQEFVVEDLSNWYVRRSRRRFWKAGDPADKRAAYDTLFACLETVARLLAPYTPFVSEELHQSLVRPAFPEAPKSVHWCDYPVADRAAVDEKLERNMELVRRIVAQGRAARNAAGVRTRQPLSIIATDGLTEKEKESLFGEPKQIILEELNVKEMSFLDYKGQLFETVVKPNYPVLGKKVGPAMKELASKLQSEPADVLWADIQSGGWTTTVGGHEFKLTEEDVIRQQTSRPPWSAQAEGPLTVAVDTRLNEELRAEGLVREFAHRIQTLRKSAEFDVTDRIRLFLEELSPGLAAAAARHEQFIREEVLAEEVLSRAPGNGPSEEWTFDGERARVGIERVHKGG